jgi:hypothetical protein
MEQWHRKYVGIGGQVYQSLRELRDLRYRLDREVTSERCWLVSEDLETSEVSVYFPPGNGAMAIACNAVPCPPPSFTSGRHYQLSKESLPIVPVAPDDMIFGPPTQKSYRHL